MTEEEIQSQIEINSHFSEKDFLEHIEYHAKQHQEELEACGMTEEEYIEYMERLSERSDEEIMEDQKSNEAWWAIENLVKEFEELSPDLREYFLRTVNFLEKYKGVDIYTATRLEMNAKQEQTLLDNRLIEIERAINRVASSVSNDQQSVETKTKLSVADFSKKYNIGKTQQQALRDFKKLPYHQLVANGKITYNVEEVERWFQNNRV